MQPLARQFLLAHESYAGNVGRHLRSLFELLNLSSFLKYVVSKMAIRHYLVYSNPTYMTFQIYEACHQYQGVSLHSSVSPDSAIGRLHYQNSNNRSLPIH